MNVLLSDGHPQVVDTSVAHNAANSSAVVEGATAGCISLTILMGAMFGLEERLTTNTKDILIKYLVRQDNTEALVDQFTVSGRPEDGIVDDVAQESEQIRFS